MSIVGWIVFGVACGWLASRIIQVRGEGTLHDVALGVAGAVLGGWLFARLGAVAVHGFNLSSMGVAVAGAVVMLLVYHALFGRQAST